jgi:16S rRNA C967 or C1407 C5-methylase (RsmB/RsmF family)
MLRTYLKEDDFQSLIQVEVNNIEALKAQDKYMKIKFDRILVDAPCTNDRHSLYTDTNNIFSKMRTDERTALCKKQTELLT